MPDRTPRKPPIHWVEGLVNLFDASFPHDGDDPRRLGWAIGRQIVGLYVIEILLKYALDASGASYKRNHNLHQLFLKLSPIQRRRVEKRYTAIQNSLLEETSDVAVSAESLLQYLGSDPITDTRYYWETNRTSLADRVPDASIIIMPKDIHVLLYSLFIALHKYPTKPITKRYNTRFYPLEQSLLDDQQK